MVNPAISHATLPRYLRSSADQGDQRDMHVALASDQRSVLLAAAGNVKLVAPSQSATGRAVAKQNGPPRTKRRGP